MIYIQIWSLHCWLSSPCTAAGGVLKEILEQLLKVQVPLPYSELASDQCAGNTSGKS